MISEENKCDLKVVLSCCASALCGVVSSRKKREQRGGTTWTSRERSVISRISRISPLCSLSLFLSGGLYVVFLVSLCW